MNKDTVPLLISMLHDQSSDDLSIDGFTLLGGDQGRLRFKGSTMSRIDIAVLQQLKSLSANTEEPLNYRINKDADLIQQAKQEVQEWFLRNP